MMYRSTPTASCIGLIPEHPSAPPVPVGFPPPPVVEPPLAVPPVGPPCPALPPTELAPPFAIVLTLPQSQSPHSESRLHFCPPEQAPGPTHTRVSPGSHSDAPASSL